jgi:hypothetical protein
MTNADMVDWINFRVNLKKERFIPALMLALTKELDGI